MHVAFLVFSIPIWTWMSVIFLISRFESWEGRSFKILGAVGIPALLFTLGVLSYSGTIPPRTSIVHHLKPTSLVTPAGGSAQLITFIDQYGRAQIVNVTTQMGVIIPEGGSVKVTEYSAGPYLGLYYTNSNCVQPTFVVE